MVEMDYSKKLVFYKPRKAGNGAAMQFDLNAKRESVFLEAAKQVEEKRFGWNEKMVFKLAPVDISKILVVLMDRKPSIELFHDPGKSRFVSDGPVQNASLSVSKSDYGYYLKLTQKTGEGLNTVALTLTEDEAVLLKTMLETALKRIYAW
ncbi:hypothetical protein COX85_03335 [Candidatus Micrarchaeota archaeon CG_4_10_14_0_2_um_filter_55_9]|nr:MAG: hypothetical protein AUJ15_01665 [Candidatus Micrarchaeota archaeon CG1_02_55_41]PIO02787.1 MAG: hypothetical protein COT57_02240 [Candidatus Micrarchaeota archaeon CG09_land_8_20_14_0_10_55_25]PIZ91531.1 MAG: hypothetical protein COX85_03335 [Candidatus Micrarchaeota archaeon CG_4_10_14_0_2_um_filter_55_9]PJD01526.1 MAG: hypothetical protein COU38_00535 [Candidatus Micrarchaeota archaeon CG10_big_fil_rev_8_21_14_0_10_54_18]